MYETIYCNLSKNLIKWEKQKKSEFTKSKNNQGKFETENISPNILYYFKYSTYE